MSNVITQPLDCEEVASRIWDWLDNELDAAHWTAIETHLATCTGCNEHVAFARGFLRQVNAARTPADITSLRTRIRTALAVAGTEQSG